MTCAECQKEIKQIEKWQDWVMDKAVELAEKGIVFCSEKCLIKFLGN